MCFRFGRLKSLPPSVNNLFRGISFSHEDKIHEHIQESLLLGRRTKGNFACYFRSFLQVFERGFLQKISYFDGKEFDISGIKQVKTVFNIIALIFRDQDFFKRRAFLLTQLVLSVRSFTIFTSGEK